MNISESLIQLLWSAHIDSICEGMPTYFTFTSADLESLMVENDVEVGDVHKYINECALEYLDVIGEHVYLKPNALSKNASGFSAAVLLVCQQVMVVEEMVKGDFGENAYFPHLRENISSELGVFSQNPFVYTEFEKIWRTLAKEVYQLNPSKECVTFDFRDVKGMNKARRFPLSQALLTKQDGVRLIDAIGRSEILQGSDDSVFKNIVANRALLTLRGKNLTKHPWTRYALVKQLRSLSENTGSLELIRNEVRRKLIDLSRLHLVVYMDGSDWLSIEYVVNVFDEFGDVVRDQEILNGFFRSRIETNFCCILVPGNDGEWYLADKEYIPTVGDELIALYDSNKERDAVSFIVSFFGVEKDKLYFGEFHRAKKYSYIKFRLNMKTKKEFLIKGGIVCSTNVSRSSETIRFIGGISVNKSGDRFSSQHLPDKVYIGSNYYKLQGRVSVNGRFCLYESFVKDLEKVEVKDSYEIEFQEGIKFTLKVAPRVQEKQKVAVRYYNLNGRILPLSTLSDSPVTNVLTKAISHEPYKVYQNLASAKASRDLIAVSEALEKYQRGAERLALLT